MAEPTLEILTVLEKNELLIQRLYTLYAERLPEQKSFWLRIAGEENTHAQWIRALAEKAAQNKLRLRSSAIKLSSLERVQHYLEEKIEALADLDLTQTQALTTAMDIEKTVAEDRYFELFETEDEETRKIFAKLQAAATGHAALMLNASTLK